jgi:aminobenzoyl-glutamate transport protein
MSTAKTNKGPQSPKKPQAAKTPPPPPAPPKKRNFTERMLDGIERVGNKVPHPVIMFLYLIIFIILLSQVLYMFNISVTQEIAVPVASDAATAMEPYQYDSTLLGYEPTADAVPEPDYEIETVTVAVRSLLTMEGIRHMFTSFLPNFAGFSVVAVVFVAMLGVGVAEEAGMMGALIRKLVQIAPRRIITFVIVLTGVVSSIATDAGYLILIPLAAVAFIKLGRHPLAGIAAAFAGVSAAFAVNLVIAPLDGMLTEVTNEAIRIFDPNSAGISITANWYFQIASVFVMALVATIITERMIEPRLGKWDPSEGSPEAEASDASENISPAAEARGIRFMVWAFLASVGVLLLMTLIPGAPLHTPEGESSPFLASIIFIITLLFLITGMAFGYGANTLKGSAKIIAAITKTFAGLGGLILLFLIIAQFIAWFNYTNMPQLAAIGMADWLETVNIGALPLMIGLILAIMVINVIIPNSVPKWAIFAPIFVPLFMQLGVEPQTVLAAYRVGDSPTNVITPLMVYFPFIALIAQRYVKTAGIGSVIALMLPYTIIMQVVWILLFILWFLLGIPLGPGYPVAM